MKRKTGQPHKGWKSAVRKELSKKVQVLSEIEQEENETTNGYVSDNGQFGAGA